jgi:hypothetical protein
MTLLTTTLTLRLCRVQLQASQRLVLVELLNETVLLQASQLGRAVGQTHTCFAQAIRLLAVPGLLFLLHRTSEKLELVLFLFHRTSQKLEFVLFLLRRTSQKLKFVLFLLRRTSQMLEFVLFLLRRTSQMLEFVLFLLRRTSQMLEFVHAPCLNVNILA